MNKLKDHFSRTDEMQEFLDIFVYTMHTIQQFMTLDLGATSTKYVPFFRETKKKHPSSIPPYSSLQFYLRILKRLNILKMTRLLVEMGRAMICSTNGASEVYGYIGHWKYYCFYYDYYYDFKCYCYYLYEVGGCGGPFVYY